MAEGRPSPVASRHPLPGEGKRGALLGFAKQLRSRQTDAELKLWYRLRAHRFIGLQFKRQKPVGPYIVDFFCKEWSLVVELDGGQHNDRQKLPDIERDAWLEGQGLKVLRFWDHDVLNNTEAVLEQLRLSLSPLLGEGGPKGRERVCNP